MDIVIHEHGSGWLLFLGVTRRGHERLRQENASVSGHWDGSVTIERADVPEFVAELRSEGFVVEEAR
jgi:hypothetical protein